MEKLTRKSEKQLGSFQWKQVETHFSKLPDLQKIKTYTNPT